MLSNLDQQQARKTSIHLGVPSAFITKDYFVTKAIKILTCVEDEYFTLAFQGGTSLSKGYQIIQRLSEDVDFRVILKQKTIGMGKEARRKRLREYRHSLITTLRQNEFRVPEEAIKVYYEGRFMSIKAEFNDSEKTSYLKPHIAVDCFFGTLALPPEEKEITSLIKLTLGEECVHPTFPVSCVALDETAAEKWVALTRRVASTQEKPRPSDKNLVRHLYDLYHLITSGLLTGEYKTIINSIIKKDKVQFEKHNVAYGDDPLRASIFALDLMLTDKQWQKHWDTFLEQMVYEPNKPGFNEAYTQFQSFSKEILENIRNNGSLWC